MSATSDYLEQAFLNKVFRQTDFTTPTATQVALHTADPGEDGLAGEVSTGTWTNYARATVNTDGTTSPFWAAPTVEGGGGYEVSNNADIDFGTASISGAGPTLTHVTVWFGANLLYVVALPSQQTINDGNPVKFLSGSLKIGQR